MKEKILLIEDHQDIAEIVQFNLEKEGYQVITSEDGEEGIRLATKEVPALILLDLMLPRMGGIDVCRVLRNRPETVRIPVIMLTAKGEESDIVLGLGVGADDYVTKPFSPKELLARIQAVLRRSKAPVGTTAEVITFRELMVDSARHEASVDGKSVALTLSEFRLLRTFISSPGRVFTRDQLIEKIGGADLAIVDRNIDVHVSSLRKKLGDMGSYILTVRGVGYRLRE